MAHRPILTFKGPIQGGVFKSREEMETSVGSAEIAEQIIRALGFEPSFLAEKYREEYDLAGAHVAIDEAPIGVFVEIEGEAAGIDRAARLLGRTPADYRTESYQQLHVEWCQARGIAPGSMTFRDQELIPMPPAIVLTAGLGTRLDPLTRLVAKPAVPLGDRTLVEHVLEWLRQQGVSDLVLNLHHRPETITGALGDGAHLGLQRAVFLGESNSRIGRRAEAGAALAVRRFARAVAHRERRHSLPDATSPPMMAAHRRTAAAVTMAVIPNPSLRRYNGILLDEDDRVLGFVPKDPSGALETAMTTWHFVGIQVANPGVFDHLADGVPAETTSELYVQMLAERFGSLRGWRVTERFVDVGTPRDYMRAVNFSQAAVGGPRSLPAAATPATHRGARLSRSVVWPGRERRAGR